jgi:hypothetical protein
MNELNVEFEDTERELERVETDSETIRQIDGNFEIEKRRNRSESKRGIRFTGDKLEDTEQQSTFNNQFHYKSQRDLRTANG